VVRGSRKKQTCPCLTALGAELTRLQGGKNKAKEGTRKAKEKVGNEKEGEQGNSQEGEKGEGQEGGEQTAAAPAAETAVSAAPAAEPAGKVDKDGHTVVAGDTAVCYSNKRKDRHNERKASVDRLNAKHVWLTMLEGPAKGEKRTAGYSTIKAWPREQSAKKMFGPGASSAGQSPARPVSPDENCLAMFGDLHVMG